MHLPEVEKEDLKPSLRMILLSLRRKETLGLPFSVLSRFLLVRWLMPEAIHPLVCFAAVVLGDVCCMLSLVVRSILRFFDLDPRKELLFRFHTPKSLYKISTLIISTPNLTSLWLLLLFLFRRRRYR